MVARSHGLERAARRALVALVLYVAVAVVTHVAYAQFGFGRSGAMREVIVNVLYTGGLFAAAGIPFVQMLRHPRLRAVYGLFALAIFAWAAGNLYYILAFPTDSDIPFPSLADAGYVAFYPPAYVALVLVIRARTRRFLPSVWLDGLIAVLTLGAVATAFLLGPILSGVGGTVPQIATNLAYPFGDLLIGLLIVLAIGLHGWRIDRQFALLAAGLATFATADTIYVYRIAAGTYAEGTILDSLWLIGLALLSFGCLLRFRTDSRGSYEGWWVALAPTVFSLAAVAVLVYSAVASVSLAAPLLAAAALLVAFVRAGLTYRDVQALADVRRQATTDDLTGLPNRRWLVRTLRQRADARAPGTTALMIVDLNGFKEVNDTLGHPAGDSVLRQAAERIQAAVAGIGEVARLGGDEFAVLTADLDSATDCAARIEQAFGDGFAVDSLTLSLGASIGIATTPRHAPDVAALQRRADVALYAAKRTRSWAAVYDPGDDTHSLDNMTLTSDLRAAIADGRLTVAYQPKVSLATREVIGVEALARWQHPARGNIPPGEFVALAEAGGLMRALTRRILDIALAQARVWLDAGRTLPVAVNISATDLIDEGFPTVVEGLLARHRLPARFLQLEITETELISESDRTMAAIERLSEQGVEVSLDDFGTGYSSLQYLQSLRVNELKIDRAFVTHMSREDSDAAIVRCAIEVAKAFGLRVVAEGVEDGDAAAMLADLGCDAAQGYYISRPLAPADLERWLDARIAVPA